jgi:hypothetical protein
MMFELFTRPQHLNDVTVFDFMKTLGKDGGALEIHQRRNLYDSTSQNY